MKNEMKPSGKGSQETLATILRIIPTLIGIAVVVLSVFGMIDAKIAVIPLGVGLAQTSVSGIISNRMR